MRRDSTPDAEGIIHLFIYSFLNERKSFVNDADSRYVEKLLLGD